MDKSKVARFYDPRCRVLGATDSKDCVILACTVLIGLKGVTDGQTNGQTDAQAWPWLKRAKHNCRA